MSFLSKISSGAKKAAGAVTKTVSKVTDPIVRPVTKGLGVERGVSTSAKKAGTTPMKKKEDLREKAFRESTKGTQKDYNRYARAAERREAPGVVATEINEAPQAEFRAGQSALAQQLLAQSRGEGPSLAQNQLRAATDRNLAQSMAMAASGRGASPGLAMRGVQQQQAGLQSQAARDAATLRLQEQLQAQQALGQVTGQARQQDLGMAQSQADLSQQAALANQRARLDQAQLNQQAAMGYRTGASNLMTGDYERRIREQEMLSGQSIAAANRAAAAKQAEQQMFGQILGGVAAGGAAAAMSDERQKTNIKPINFKKNMSMVEGDEEDDSFLGAIKKSKKEEYGMTKGESTSKSYESKKDGIDAGSIMSGSQGYDAIGRAIALGGAKAMGAEFKPTANASDEKKKTNIVDYGSSKKFMKGFMAASDEDQKQNMSHSEDKLQSFVDAIKGYEYEYKDPSLPGAGPGKYISPMAQDLEKSEIGKNMVIDTPNGKMVDYGRASGAMLATAAMLNDKTKEIDAKLEALMRKRKKA
jgi:hypothetical protein